MPFISYNKFGVGVWVGFYKINESESEPESNNLLSDSAVQYKTKYETYTLFDSNGIQKLWHQTKYLTFIQHPYTRPVQHCHGTNKYYWDKSELINHNLYGHTWTRYHQNSTRHHSVPSVTNNNTILHIFSTVHIFQHHWGPRVSGSLRCCCWLAPPPLSWNVEATSASALRQTPVYLGVGFPWLSLIESRDEPNGQGEFQGHCGLTPQISRVVHSSIRSLHS